ncbi:hypothetical protein ACOSP7_011488 [Xanthoceras sorbifolium]
MANHAYVPKFGNWDKEENITYTSSFGNAHKGKAESAAADCLNNPKENPEALMNGSGGLDSTDGDYRPIQASINNNAASSKNTYNHQKSGRNNNITAEFGNSTKRSNSDHSLRQPTASVPKFGAWDDTDPTSGEGFTVILNKVKEEKEIASAKFPTHVLHKQIVYCCIFFYVEDKVNFFNFKK